MSMRLTISSGLGPIEARVFVARLADALVRDAASLGLAIESVVVHGDAHAPRSIDLGVVGDAASLGALVGTHALVERSTRRSRHDRKRWYVGVALCETAPESARAIDAADVRFETMRAGGPGGQHVQKTESAVRVVHLPTGITVRVSSERSQHQNRARALTCLAAALAERDANARADAKTRRRATCLRVERGRAVMTWHAHEGALVASKEELAHGRRASGSG